MTPLTIHSCPVPQRSPDNVWRRISGRVAQRASLCACLLAQLNACTIVPINTQNAESRHIAAQPGTRIERRLKLEGYQPVSGESSAMRLQASGYEAWEDRVRLAQLADISLDLQYFSWNADESGLILLSHVIAAADRGVRVRLLLDDMLAVHQDVLAKVDAHDNIEVRMFNPFSTQRINIVIRPFEWLIKERVNVRMHNKIFVADGQVGIIGGRNIGNRYFWLDSSYNQRDLDAFVLGGIITDLQSSFDDYWNSPWAVPISALESPVKPHKARRYYKALTNFREQQKNSKLFAALPETSLSSYRISRDLVTARMELIADTPDKVVERDTATFERIHTLTKEQVEKRLLVGMSYVVPTASIMAQARELTGRGVKLEILTNSMHSIDFPAAFSGYTPYRRELLELGAELHEFAADANYPECPETCRNIHMGFHSKYMVFDHHLSYVGSMNYDPRSIDLNTEAGLLIYSQQLNAQLSELFYQDAATRNSWRVHATRPMRWTRPQADGTLEISNSEPRAPSLTKLGVRFWGLMPFRDQY